MVTGFRLGEADRVRRPKGDLDAVAVSWTIGSEDDGPSQYLTSFPVSHLDQRAAGGRPGVRPGRASKARARGADAGPTAPPCGAALIQ